MLTFFAFLLFCAALAAGLVWAGINVLYLLVVLVFKLAWLPFALLLGLGKGVVIVATLLIFFVLKLAGMLSLVAVIALGLFVIWGVSRLMGARKPSSIRQQQAMAPRAPVYDTPWDRDRAHVSSLRTKFERIERRLANLETLLSER